MYLKNNIKNIIIMLIHIIKEMNKTPFFTKKKYYFIMVIMVTIGMFYRKISNWRFFKLYLRCYKTIKYSLGYILRSKKKKLIINSFTCCKTYEKHTQR